MPKGVPKNGKRVTPPFRREGLPAIPEALQQACTQFEAAAGGRDSLVAHLAHLRLTPVQDLVVGMIADPRNQQHSLARVCQLADITFGELLHLFRDAGFAKAQLHAMQKVWARTPELAEDIMTRALPHHLPCGVCKAKGFTKRRVVKKVDGRKQIGWVEEQCQACDGTTQVLVQPSGEAQDRALSLTGLVQEQKAPPVQVNIGAGAGGTTLNLQQFIAASDETLYGSVVDAEVVGEGGESDAGTSETDVAPRGTGGVGPLAPPALLEGGEAAAADSRTGSADQATRAGTRVPVPARVRRV